MDATVCVNAGDQIEVLWKITRTMDDEDVVENKWWPAKVECRLPGCETDAQGRELWRLLYDEVDEFAAETRTVSFVGEHELIDGTSGDEMAWRRQGDNWDHDDMEDDENLASDRMYTPSELASMVDSQVRDVSGGASEEEVMRTLQNTVPPQQLLQGASAMRDFIDKFKEHMMKTVASSQSGEPLIVTKAMVDEFTKSLHSK